MARFITAAFMAAIMIVGGRSARAENTTVLCTYSAPGGHTFPFILDLDKQVLLRGRDMLDGDQTTDAPLYITDDAISWISKDGYRFELDRTTMVLAVNGIHMFDCVVAHKQL